MEVVLGVAGVVVEKVCVPVSLARIAVAQMPVFGVADHSFLNDAVARHAGDRYPFDIE